LRPEVTTDEGVRKTIGGMTVSRIKKILKRN